jgi:hypothetical protein
MANSFGSSGLVTATQAELVTQYTNAFETIYGTDINLGPETPDGQIMMIFIQSVLDLEDLLTQIYNSFDPDNAIGTVLDQRVAINGIQRLSGTYTITDITIVTSQSLNFYGLDQTVQPVYTVADAAGNQWQLQGTHLGAPTGTNIFSFQAAVTGALQPIPNTINIPVTVLLGVTSINNPTTYLVLGINEETDAMLKVRRQQSVSLPSQGYFAGLVAALLNIPGVTFATVHENDTGSTDATGTPGHSIWVVVGGAGSAATIANTIYVERSAGCGLYNSGDAGAMTYIITQLDGSLFPVYWDQVIEEPLFIKFTATSLNGINLPNISAIITQLPEIYVPGVNAEVNINQLATYVQEIDPNTLVTNAGFSTSAGGAYTNTLTPANINRQLQVSTTDTIILPMQLSPLTSSVTHGSSETFTTLGGYSTYTYSISINNSGGSINSSTGVYTAGSTHPVTDTVEVTDSLSNTATATVSVT